MLGAQTPLPVLTCNSCGETDADGALFVELLVGGKDQPTMCYRCCSKNKLEEGRDFVLQGDRSKKANIFRCKEAHTAYVEGEMVGF